ncbi:lactosylceramide 4-alpha-galactosyltransferase [Procambarus clarkii]|uniref:lactosylceramide 4-alpha-galactosyltransferase n=1 Tax=Procambarus clarkii TaxID=6728 RepID=UPI003741EAF6
MALPTLNHTHPLIEVVSSLRNVKMAWLDLDQIFSEEPMGAWHRDRLWMLSRHMAVMVSDGARAELLRRYGGTYIDLDAITLRPLPSSTNWMARLAEDVITTGILSFEARHSLWQAFVNDIPEVFEPSGYLSIGAMLLTHHVQRLCPAALSTSVSHDQQESCGNITIWPRRLFYPTPNQAPWEVIFKDGEGLGPDFFKSTDAYSLHLFNHLSGKFHPNLSGDSIVREAARRNCPQVLKVLEEQRTFL